MPKKETKVEQEAREVIEKIANNIAALSQAVQSLLDGRLKKKALLVLLAHSSGKPQYVVENILDTIADLGKTYLKK